MSVCYEVFYRPLAIYFCSLTGNFNIQNTLGDEQEKIKPEKKCYAVVHFFFCAELKQDLILKTFIILFGRKNTLQKATDGNFRMFF